MRLVYNLRFPGQYFDQETGLNYNYFRDYDPSTGRYVESDPIGLGGGSYATYTYVSSNPVGNIDTLGLQKIPEHPSSAAVDPPLIPPSYTDQQWNQAVNAEASAIDDAVSNGVNAVADAIHNLCDQDCAQIAARIKTAVGVLRSRYVAALVDKEEMYSNARFGQSMTWESHELEYEAQQRNLQRQIARAKAKGCVYDSDADVWAAKPTPMLRSNL